MTITKHLDTDLIWQDQDFDCRPEAEKSICITRYGGFGDMVQAASVFPYFKEQGYHVTVNTTPRGYGIVKNDPNIDAFFLQDDNQVPPEELEPFWKKLASYFDRHLQLSECVEGSLLAVPGREEYTLPKEDRHALMDVNYLENIHRMAGIEDAPFRPYFYPTPQETKKAKGYRQKLGKKNFVILWSLAGSSVHKAWPYVDNVIANLLQRHPNTRVIMVGDALCQILELGWEKEKRVICKSGKWSIRKSLSMIPHVDLVIGTETGVLNCAGMLDTPKIIMLSHSTHENLTKHWINTAVMEPEETPCYPCHQMHYGFRHCNRDEMTGTSVCAANIGYDKVIEAVDRIIEKWGRINEYLSPVVPGSARTNRSHRVDLDRR